MAKEQASQNVVGWGRLGARWARPDAPGVSRALAERLHSLGITHAFGMLGGGIAPFAAGLAQSPIRFHSFRHEAGAGFAAIEAYFATNRPAAVIVTTGPGLFNVLNPMMAARIDGAKVLLISGFTARSQAGRGAVQETTPQTLPGALIQPGTLFHDVAIPESADELPAILARLQQGFAKPGGWVAHIGLPISLQCALLEAPLPPPSPGWSYSPQPPSPEALDACLDALLDPHAVLWIGHGARGAAETLKAFAEGANLPVVTSPRAKGVFPERHPLFIGVSGAGGSPTVKSWFKSRPPKNIVVVGSRLGEVTSFLSSDVVPLERYFHVDIDPSAFGSAFPHVPGLGIVADAHAFFADILARTTPHWRQARSLAAAEALRGLAEVCRSPVPLLAQPGDIRPMFLMQAIQNRIVDGSDVLVMSEAGTSFTWSNAGLRFETPGRYRMSARWGSMGHFTTGCVGAAIASGRKVVAIVGDGAMLMNNEINTAVQYGASVTWIVLNDAQFGLNEHGMLALGMIPVETQLPRTNFVTFAQSQGADGIVVTREEDLDDALDQAMRASGPFVVDVRIDRTIPSPVVTERKASLLNQTDDPGETLRE